MNIWILNFLTWIFIFLCGIAGLGVFLKKNPVHSVLCLIAAFFSGSILILINNSEFLSMILITVYVGAVAVLFLFIVMMVDTTHLENNKNKKSEIFLGFLIASGFFFILFSSFLKEVKSENYKKLLNSISESLNSVFQNNSSKEKFSELAKILYNGEHVFSVIVISFILFVSIIGVIILTLKEKTGLKKQNPLVQNMRTKDETLEVKKVAFGQGVNDE